MSHTFKPNGHAVVFVSDCGLRGTVRLSGAAVRVTPDGVEVPTDALVEFVASLVRQDHISDLEDRSAYSVLGIRRG